MNKEYHELVNRIKELTSEIKELDRYIYPIKYFVNERGEYFKNSESIEALNILKEDINKVELLREKKDKERREIFDKLTEKCDHPVFINKMCPICGKWFYDVPDAYITIEIPSISNEDLRRALFTTDNRKHNNECLNKLIEIIKAAIKEKDTLASFEDGIEELQYEKDVNIRRKVR
jgi:hypothetical protein